MKIAETEQFKNNIYTYIDMRISKTEREAETINKLASLGLIDKELFVYMAMHLQKRYEISGCYFQFLILRRAKLIGGLNFLLNT